MTALTKGQQKRIAIQKGENTVAEEIKIWNFNRGIRLILKGEQRLLEYLSEETDALGNAHWKPYLDWQVGGISELADSIIMALCDDIIKSTKPEQFKPEQGA